MQRFVGICIVAAAVLLGSSHLAQAQTVSVGPYYATPSWDQTIACPMPSSCSRFVVLANFNSEAVLDRETGLVWERTPDGRTSQTSGMFACVSKHTGGRKGWRLPTIAELTSLIDATGDLPPGHPFVNVQHYDALANFFVYWSATPGDDSRAFFSGFGGPTGVLPVSESHFYWCVRGPGGA